MMNFGDEIEEKYFDWMYKAVIKSENHVSYRKLLSILYSREFYYSIQMDKNRKNDGIYLRGEFIQENPEYYVDEFDENLSNFCSVLEVMVALSRRIEQEYLGETADWFMQMLENMGINDLDDDHFDPEIAEKSVDILLGRRYLRSGKGGLFALNDPPEDLRNVEIWQQMQLYLCEKCLL